MGNPESSSDIKDRGGFNNKLVEELREIEAGHEAAISPESLNDGDSFLEGVVDRSVEGIRDFIEDFDGGFEDTDDKAIFIAGRIGLLLMKLFALRQRAGGVFAGIKGEDIGTDLVVAKTAIEQGEWGLFLNF